MTSAQPATSPAALGGPRWEAMLGWGTVPAGTGGRGTRAGGRGPLRPEVAAWS